MATIGEPLQISSHTVDKVAKAKLTLETYYSNLVTQHAERENRYVSATSVIMNHLIYLFIIIVIIINLWLNT